MAHGPRYRGAADDLRITALDELTAVYHRPSGITHLVGAPVPEILELLGTAPMSAEEVLAGLAAAYDLADADRDAVAARLDELAAAGLVTRA